jgi:2-C-methyl-D-erythritol 4-phosphate cytidylyltransferase
MAGRGRRFGAGVPKVYLDLAGEPMWRRPARLLAGLPGCVGIVLVVEAERVEEVAAGAEIAGARVVAGGARRQDSVRAGLAALHGVIGEAEVVAVHDAARPLVDARTALLAISAAREHGAALVAAPARDTVKRVDDDGRVTETLDRDALRFAQTPQAFRVDLLRAAHARALADGIEATDDAALVEATGGDVRVVPGPTWNLKVTEPEDLVVAEALLRARGEAR